MNKIQALVRMGATLFGLGLLNNTWSQDLWRGRIEMGGRPMAAIARFNLQVEPISMTLHLADLGLMNLRFREVEAELAEVRLSTQIGNSTLILKGDFVTDTRFAGHWSRGAMSGTFELNHDVGEEFPFSESELRVGLGSGAAQDSVELAATLIMPKGSGPFPTIIWTHGSGAMGRMSNTYVREPYRLALEGIASVIYDKRGVGESGGDLRAASFHDLARDAVAVKQSLMDHGKVDPARVGIAGISQGPSWIAPIAIGLDPSFAFLISISATSDPPPVQHLYVVENRLKNAGFDLIVIEEAKQLHRACDLWERTGAGTEALNERLRQAEQEPWFGPALLPTAPITELSEAQRSWMWLDPMDYWSKLQLPVFACWGSADEITDPVRSARMIRESLGGKVQVFTYQGANHSLELSGVPQPAPLAPGFHADLIAWLNSLDLKGRGREFPEDEH